MLMIFKHDQQSDRDGFGAQASRPFFLRRAGILAGRLFFLIGSKGVLEKRFDLGTLRRWCLSHLLKTLLLFLRLLPTTLVS